MTRTVLILLLEFLSAINYVKDRPGRYLVGANGDLEILLTDLFTERDQVDFVKDYLITGRRKGWLEDFCHIGFNKGQYNRCKVVLQLQASGPKMSSSIDINDFSQKDVNDLDKEWRDCTRKKRKLHTFDQK